MKLPRIHNKEAEAIIGLFKLRGDSMHQSKKKSKYNKTGFQYSVLREIYAQTKFPSSITRDNVAYLLGIKPRVIQIWFQNKRQNERKKKVPTKRKKSFIKEYYNDDNMTKEEEKTEYVTIEPSDIIYIYLKCKEQTEQKNVIYL